MDTMDKKMFQDTEKLYHYTKFESAIKIISSQQQKFGTLESMNDINESYKGIFYQSDEIPPKTVKSCLRNYRQISLTMDKPGRQGFDIPAMWGHYADKGDGVCLVYDKNKLLASINGKPYKHGKITYTNKYDNTIIVDDNYIDYFLKRHMGKLFFTKTRDWSYEQEFRILTVSTASQPLFLPLNGSIIAVIMHSKNDDSVLGTVNAELIRKITNIPILEYAHWFDKLTLRDISGHNWLHIKEEQTLDI